MGDSLASVLEVAALALAIVMLSMSLLVAGLTLARRASTAFRGAGAEGAAGARARDALDPALVAVLTAAAAEALRRPVALHRIHVHGKAEGERWSRAGRMDIMVSHRVEPRR